MALAGTNPTWHVIYDVTCVQNEASEWQQCYHCIIATAEDMWLNCRTRFCKAAGETVKDKSKSGLNIPIQPLRWTIYVILRCAPLCRSWPFGLSHCYIKKSNCTFFLISHVIIANATLLIEMKRMLEEWNKGSTFNSGMKNGWDLISSEPPNYKCALKCSVQKPSYINKFKLN